MTPAEWWAVYDVKVREANAQLKAQGHMSRDEREYLLSLID